MPTYPEPDSDFRPRRRRNDCQCDGTHLGACPGPENCPYSGRMPEEPPTTEETNETPDPA